ncbi:MAG: hypothetical protein ABSC94_32210 [Polyangiaceae bacterium]|jgi:hypothetical protein
MLRRIGDEIWSHENDVRLPGGLLLPSRATIVRLGDGALVLHSPLAIDDATARRIGALGDVRFLLAPNCLHWMFLKAAKERYPKARIFGAPGVEKKLGALPFEPLPEAGHIGAIGEDLHLERVQGVPFMSEHAMFHQRSRSLIVTDLLFNVHHCRNFMMNLFLRLVGAHNKTAQSRIWRLLVKDRAAAARSVSKILRWDFEHLVVAHGDVVSDDARERARRALSWMADDRLPLLGTGSAVG